MKDFKPPKKLYIILSLTSLIGTTLNVGLGIFFYNRSLNMVSYTFYIAGIYFFFTTVFYLITKRNNQLIFAIGSIGVLSQILVVIRYLGTDTNFHIYLLLLSIITILTIKTGLLWKLLIAIIPLMIYVYFEESGPIITPEYQLDEITTNIFNISNYLVVILIYLVTFIYYYQTYELQLKTLKQLSDESKEHDNQKTNFLSRMSHEIRNPMNGIIGLTELLAQEELSPQIRQYVTGIQDSSSILISIVNDILDISKIDAGKFDLSIQEFNFKEMLKGLQFITNTKNRNSNVAFIFEVDEDIDTMFIGDGTKLRQIFSNLIDNSFRFTSSGYVKVKIDYSKKVNDEAELICSVEDTGIGIKEDDISKLFQSYQQVNYKDYGKGGTGLGLLITKKIVELMGGRIYIESKYGIGTKVRFNVFLKRTNHINNFIKNPKIIESDSLFHSTNSRVLIVDDNHINAIVLAKMLKNYGIITDVCHHGLEALHLLNEQKAYDLMIFDHIMPDISGIDLIKEVKKKYTKYQGTPVVSLTASAFSEEVELLKKSGFEQVLVKPVTIQQIEVLLKSYLLHKGA